MENPKTKKFIKRGYNFSEELLEQWEKFHYPSKDYSPSAAGAFLIWMAMTPEIREKARGLATTSNVKLAVNEIREFITKQLKVSSINDYLGSLNEAQLAMTLQAAKEVAEKMSRSR